MIAFVGTAALMVAVALAWIMVPLLRPRAASGLAAEASNLAILRGQRTELEADLANGIITREHYEQALRELTQRVAEDTRAAAGPGGPAPIAGAWTAAIVAGSLPIAATLLYLILGGHGAFGPAAESAPAAAESGQHEMTPEKVAAMAANLAARLEKEPDNPQGWIVLAHTYYAMKRFPEAVKAYERAAALAPNDADLLADYADALGATQQSLAGKPTELINRALAANPGQWKALALAGTVAFDNKDYKQAVVYWERLQQVVPPESEIGRSIGGSIAEARQLGGMAPAAAAPDPMAALLPPPASVVPPAAARPDQAAPKLAAAPPAAAPKAPAAPAAAKGAAGAPAAAKGGNAIAGTVSLSPKLAATAAPDDLVFIFARPAQGPKMPLAVMRKKVSDLPATFSLDDTMAMAPEMKISNFADVVIGARVSKSGNAVPSSGDLEGFSQPVKIGSGGVAVVIDTARP